MFAAKESSYLKTPANYTNMLIENYTFTCQFINPSFLPEFKGSTLRGGFGHALKKISCALRCRTCDSCLLFDTCAYAFLFEVKKGGRAPHPYIIVPPATQQRTYQKGDIFKFGITLFGRANNYLPHVIYAIREMGKNGLGKGQADQGKLIIKTVSQGDKTVFADNHLKPLSPISALELSKPLPLPVDRLTIECLTPLRLKQSNELRDSLPFHLLIRATLRRISTLEKAFGNGEPDLDYKGIAARATEIQVDQAECRWQEIKRYSNRQRRAMMLGGIKGRISYKGASFAEFLPLLNYCQQTHLGKQTSFGLGEISVTTGQTP